MKVARTRGYKGEEKAPIVLANLKNTHLQVQQI